MKYVDRAGEGINRTISKNLRQYLSLVSCVLSEETAQLHKDLLSSQHNLGVYLVAN